MTRQIIDELLNKARSYPKVEGYLRGLDKKRIDEGEDVPVTKRETAVRTADENAAKRLESQGKSSIDDLLKEVSVKRQGYTSIDKRHHADDETDYEESSQYHLSDSQKKQSEGRVGGIKSSENKKKKEKEKYHSSTTAPKSGHTDEGKRIISEHKASQRKKIEEGTKKRAAAEAQPNSKNTWMGLSMNNEDLVKSIEALMEKAKVDKLVDQFKFEGDKGHETGDYVKRQLRAGRKRSADSDPLTTPISQRYGRGDDNKYDKSMTEIEKANKDYKINTKTIEQHEHPYGGHTVVTEGEGKNKKVDSVSLYDRQEGKMRISRGTKGSKGIPIDAEHEQELKNASMTTIIDELLEKAVYGPGTRGGKPERPTGNVRKKTGKVTHPQLSKEQQEKILRTSQEKASRGLDTAGQHKEAAKVRGQVNTVKSLDERTADLAKSMYDVVNNRRFSKMDPDAGIERKKNERMDAEGVGLEPSRASKYAESNASDSDTDESLDAGFEKHAPSNKGFAPEKVGGAVGRAYVSGDPKKHEQSKRVAVKFHGKNRDPKATERYNEAMTDEVWSHNLKTAEKSQKDVCDMWQTDSPYISKGAKVMPLGPGGEVQTLVKDEQRKPGGRTPSYAQTDKAQEKVETGQYERERKAKKKIAEMDKSKKKDTEDDDLGAE